MTIVTYLLICTIYIEIQICQLLLTKFMKLKLLGNMKYLCWSLMMMMMFVCVCVCVYSVTQSCLTLCDSTDYIAFKAPLSMEFSRQEYWSRLPLPSPGDLPGPGIKPKSLVSPALASGFLITCAIWEVLMITVYCFPGLKISRSMSCLKSLYFVVSTMETSTEKMLDLWIHFS